MINWKNDPPFDRGWNDWHRLRDSKDPQDIEMLKTATRAIWHVYRNVDRLNAQILAHRIQPDDTLLSMSRLVRSMLTRKTKAGMSITGGAGCHEGWSDDQHSHDHAETCATAYNLMFFDGLMSLDGALSEGDVMERMIYNTLFAAQAPEGFQLRYYTAFSGPRRYYGKRQTFCCPGNYRRAIAHLPEYVYYREQEGLAVNLYTASDATLRLANGETVRLRQETDYPNSGTVRIEVSPEQPSRFPLRLRFPRWCQNPSLSVNGEAVAGPRLDRVWKPGDVIELSLPMRWRWVAGRDLQQGRAALLRGPVVFCLSRDLNKLPSDLTLRDIVLDPGSVSEPAACTAIRPDGQLCKVKGWSPGKSQSDPPDLDLTFTEFPDPSGEETFFLLRDPAAAEEDELFGDSASPTPQTSR